jgi:hypothetical protein
MSQAQNYAQQIVSADSGTQQRLYRYLQNTDPQLHALTKEMAGRIRRQTGAQAVQQLTTQGEAAQ